MTGPLQRLHRDQRGALAPLILFVMLFFAWALTALLNTGQNTYDKVDAQNAADAISIGVTEQAARDLNVMVANHVASSQTFTIAVVAYTLNEVIFQSKMRLAAIPPFYATCRLGKLCPIAIAWATADFAAQALRLFSIESTYRPSQGLATANRVTRALGRMNEHLVRSFPQRASEITRTLATRNRVRSAFVYPVCSPANGSDCNTDVRFPGPSLPVEDNDTSARFEMCWGVYLGSDNITRLDFRSHGFATGKGPYTGGGSSGMPHLRDFVNQRSGMSSFLPSFDMDIEVWNAVAFSFFTPPRFFTRQRSTSNDFTNQLDFNMGQSCLLGSEKPGLTGWMGSSRIEMPRNYWLKGRPSIAGFGGTVGSAAALMSFDFTDYGFLHVVAREKSARSNPEDFVEPDEPFFAYAQSMVFNPMVFDLYSSRWIGELVPSRHMDEAWKVGQAMQGQRVSSDFRVLAAILRAGGASPDWRAINGH